MHLQCLQEFSPSLQQSLVVIFNSLINILCKNQTLVSRFCRVDICIV